ncbi:MAG TPA: DUF5309 family protein, partial [Gammaproteobacteria bacterium]|nr:DUF5309 family protein [Gammaproteobacteria bacterium]
LEDQLLPNADAIDDASISSPTTESSFDVANGDRFRVGDQIRADGSGEVMLVTGIASNTLTVVRGYGNTTAEPIFDALPLRILCNAALEGDDAPTARFTNRVRQSNVTQIFTAGVEVSGSQLAAKQAAIADELDYQKQERLRELIRDLENCVINGVMPAADEQGSSTVRRTMRGIIPSITTNVEDASAAALTEDLLNANLRAVWEQSNGGVDTILVGGLQKRAINQFIASSRGYDARNTRYRDMVSVYESDFGVCRVVLSRWVPADTVVLLDSSRIDVLPLSGRSFHYKPLSADGDRERGQVIGEYTLEMRNELAHGVIRNLAVS